ncbi:glycoside hydrolase family 5 protein [Paenibacillus sp.]|uniref:glycoside hydrolase family 5 protein n=1 Tax=Paenibacillus sp. TaxID=58172 RepID=UPI002D64E721|nr:cellulase family glycosylhydrolase [Paenibacillus sp.]HZG56458.1 cellulase family glycosylhydrolase [Paenibacillus sp.]
MDAAANEVCGFLRASGRRLVNGEGRELLLRGVGFGSWLLPEGYMWRFPDAGDRPRRIERMVESLVGAEEAERFWDEYYDTYVAEADIRAVAAHGFNSVRVPINARTLIENETPLRLRPDRLALLDRVIAWCRTYKLYVILDLHGAPGGQTGTNIDDSEHDRPELFLDEKNKQLTIALWRLLAERYKDEWIVAGYDLLNEPLPDWFAAYNDQVMPLYRDIIQAIREVDDRHMIILEGAHWATDWSIFTEKLDENVMLQFHKYWNAPDAESLRAFLEKRDEWDVPIFMGEGGENNCDWFAGAFRLYEDLDISWNFWTWKKLDCTNSPYSVRKPEGWDLLVAYLEGGDKPEPSAARGILRQYLEHLRLENCDYRPQVVNALFRRPPVRIPAAFYGYGGEGVGFGVRAKTESATGFRAGDGTDIRFVVEGARERPNFQHMKGEEWQPDEWLYVRLAADDWLAYDVTLRPEQAALELAVELRMRTAGGSLLLFWNGEAVGAVAPTAEEWQTVRLSGSVQGAPGTNRLKVSAYGHPVGLQWVSVSPHSP